MPATSNQSLGQVLHELYAESGAPREAWKAAGNFYKKLEKSYEATVHAFIVDPENDDQVVAYVPIEEDVGTNGGANEQLAYQNASGVSLIRFRVPISQHWTYAKIKNTAHRMITPDSNQYGMDGRMIVATRAAAQCKQELSWLFWADGTGRASKGDGAYDVATAVIKLKNRRSAKRFKKNTIINLIPWDQAFTPGVMAIPRAGTLTVIAKNEQTGELTCSGNINTIVGADARDYIGIASMFGGELPVVNGVFTTLPITNTLANTTLYNVDRSLDPTVRAGRRVQIDGSMDMWSIGARLIGEATEGMTDTVSKRTIYFPTNQLEEVVLDAAQFYTIQQASTESDPTRIMFGVTEPYLDAPGLGRVGLQCDPWLCDIEVSDDEDRTVVMLVDDDWKVQTAPGGENWYTPTGSQFRDAGPGSVEQAAQYGLTGQLLNLNTSQQILASTRADS